MGKTKYDIRGRRLMSMKMIYIQIPSFMIFFAIFALLANGTIAVVMAPVMALGFGWQLGCLTERNDWQRWYEERGEDAKK